jgi:hypothetical protein
MKSRHPSTRTKKNMRRKNKTENPDGTKRKRLDDYYNYSYNSLQHPVD